METRHEAGGVDHERRAALLLGLMGASVVALSRGRDAHAQQAVTGQVTEVAPGLTRRVVADVPSVLPGYAMVRLVELTFGPGVKGPPMTMRDPMVCEMGRGELDETKNGQPFKRKVGDVWTCAVGDVDVDTNNGIEPAVMRIFMLMKA